MSFSPRFGRRCTEFDREWRTVVSRPILTEVHSDQAPLSQQNRTTTSDDATEHAEPDSKPSVEAIATAILRGPVRILQQRLPNWKENLEELKPRGSSAASNTPAELLTSRPDTIIDPGIDPSIDQRSEECERYHRALQYRDAVNHLLQCLADVTAREVSKLGRRGPKPRGNEMNQREKNLLQVRYRVGDAIWAMYREIQKQYSKAANGVFACLAGK